MQTAPDMGRAAASLDRLPPGALRQVGDSDSRPRLPIRSRVRRPIEPVPFQRQRALIDLREAIWWRLWDRYGDVAKRCAIGVRVESLCWYAVRVHVRGPDDVTVRGTGEASCRPRDVSLPTEPQVQLEECIRLSLGDVDDVHVGEVTAASLLGFDGTVDVEMRIAGGEEVPSSSTGAP